MDSEITVPKIAYIFIVGIILTALYMAVAPTPNMTTDHWMFVGLTLGFILPLLPWDKLNDRISGV